jgi:hypothetical protein
MWENLILPKLGKEKLAHLSAADVDTLHREISTVREAPIRANRAVASLRKAFNLAIRWEMVAKNPVAGVKKNPEERRDRFLNKNEIAALALALVEHSDRAAANAIKLLMLTGARKSEVTARRGICSILKTAFGQSRAPTRSNANCTASLECPALNLLIQIKQQAEADYRDAKRKGEDVKSSPFVFPSDVSPDQRSKKSAGHGSRFARRRGDGEDSEEKPRGKPIKDKKDKSLPLMAERPHSRSAAFVCQHPRFGWASLPLIGQMLGHTQVQTTQRYAHLYDDPLRKAANMVGDVIMPPHRKLKPPRAARRKAKMVKPDNDLPPEAAKAVLLGDAFFAFCCDPASVERYRTAKIRKKDYEASIDHEDLCRMGRVFTYDPAF